MLAGSPSMVGRARTSALVTEMLDTETMAFARGPSMQARRLGCTAVLLPGERRVFVAGGDGNGTTRLATTEILDIVTMTFSTGPVITLARSNCAVVSLPSSILVVGGHDGHAMVNTTEALSLETMTFTAGPTTHTARDGCAAFALPQGHSPRRAHVVDGRDIYFSGLSSTEVLTAAGWEENGASIQACSTSPARWVHSREQ